MRFVITLAFAAAIGTGCASKNKNQPAPASPAAAATEKMKADAKLAAKHAKKEVKDTAAAATAAATGDATKVECKMKGETRLLEVRSKDKGCEIAYTKAGQENVVGSSMNGTTHCQGISDRIKEKLVAAGYTCN